MFETMNLFDGLVSTHSYLVQNVDGGVRLLLSLPGVKKENVTVSCTATELKVNVSGDECPLLIKRKYKFSHKIGDPQSSARVSDGVLTVDLISGQKDKNSIDVRVD